VLKTYPNLRAVHAERLAMEAKLKSSPAFLSPEQRDLLLLEPFALLSTVVEGRFKNSGQFDAPSGIGCAGTIIVACGMFIWSLSYQGSIQEKMLIAAAVLGGLGLIYTLVQLHLAPSRYVRSRITPVLARALRPLGPTREEIDECLESFKNKKTKIGKVVKVEDVWREINR